MQNQILGVEEGRIIFMCLKFVSELRKQVFSAPEQIQRAILSPEDIRYFENGHIVAEKIAEKVISDILAKESERQILKITKEEI